MSDVIKFPLIINGFDVEAIYPKESMEKIFFPLLEKLTKLQKEKQERIIVYLAAPPAVGKSTLASVLAYLSRTNPNYTKIQDVGIDGFHYPQSYILTHTIEKDGKKIPMKDVKGCPETFDIDKLSQAIQQAKTKNISWPIYDRTLHDVVENQIILEKDIILVEGNWLLLKDEKWNTLINYSDFSIFIKADESILKERLIKRKIKGGLSEEEALRFYLNSDKKNVQRVLDNSRDADCILSMDENLNYYEEE